MGKAAPPKEKKPYAERVRAIQKKVRGMINEYKEDPENRNLYDQLDSVRRVIERHVPISEDITDELYIRYYDCCCCGEPALPEGNELSVAKGVRHLKYQKCKKCTEEDSPPDPWKVATMYATHAITLDQSMTRLREAVRSPQ